uniref:Uncharacterized protein n=1 Tax=Corvus moneduloides TaxID=1196302 RepID=A0A8U7NNJ1_CORMO
MIFYFLRERLGCHSPVSQESREQIFPLPQTSQDTAVPVFPSLEVSNARLDVQGQPGLVEGAPACSKVGTRWILRTCLASGAELEVLTGAWQNPRSLQGCSFTRWPPHFL